MGEPCVAHFVGGPWDGQVRELPDRPQRIEVPVLSPGRGATDMSAPVPVGVGIYHLMHTRFGDPWRYEWREPAPPIQRPSHD